MTYRVEVLCYHFEHKKMRWSVQFDGLEHAAAAEAIAALVKARVILKDRWHADVRVTPTPPEPAP